ncbi:transcriptional regulator, LysR family [Noviherbaspirillum humi]|uniref:Transcriptional regulator, LysR family n=1 Tax=Noviherbaspirillum humi TaxID=1688639 RepID=A0A239EXE5_9BURK|nr:LysR family transcriptional regulator [Noviherbaspirillum humi]SNS49101.1 transcriptional regulator, LysR family [Noviherbaspirillum humi]
MDTHFLHTFVVVAERGSIAAAARQLNLTPAAVALRIQALERELDAALLMRSGRSIKPTEAGARILLRARRLLQEVRDLKADAAEEEVAGELQLGAIATALNGMLPDVLAGLGRQYPRLTVHVVPGPSDALLTQVQQGSLDAAIIVQPEHGFAKTCDWKVLREEPLVVLAPREAAVSDPDEALRTLPFIRYDRTTYGGRIADHYLRRAGIQPAERFELTSLTAIALLVDRGLGVALVPDWSPPWPEGLSLRKLPIAGRSHLRRLGLVWFRASARVRLVHALMDEAVRCMHPDPDTE